MGLATAAQSVFVRHVRKKATTTSVSTTTADEKAPSEDERTLPNLPYSTLPELRQLLATLADNTEPQQQAMINAVDALAHFIDRETGLNHMFIGLFKQPPVMVEELETALQGLRNTSVSVEKAEDEATAANRQSPSFLGDLWDSFLFVLSPEIESALELAISIEKRPVKWWWPGKQNEAEIAVASPLPTFLSRARKLHLVLGGTGGLPLEEDNPDRIDGIASTDG